MASRQAPELRVGERIELAGPSDVWRVVRVSPCAATIRSERTEHRQILGDDGQVKAEWDAPGRTLIVSLRSVVKRVERGE